MLHFVDELSLPLKQKPLTFSAGTLIDSSGVIPVTPY